MDLAVDDVRRGLLSIRAASKAYNVPYSTLHEKISGKPRGKRGAARRKLTDRQERHLTDFLLQCADIGVPLHQPMVEKLAAARAKQKGLSSSFSRSWLRAFLRRNTAVSERIIHGKRKKTREWTAETCETWVELLSELHMDRWLEDPRGVWNLDESAFSVAEKIKLVLPRRGEKSFASLPDGKARELITVLAGGNAAGTMLRPLILSDGNLRLASSSRAADDRCWLGVNQSVIMDDEVFLDYVKHELIPAMTAPKNLIMLDGHNSHVYNEDFLMECAQSGRNIRVVMFPAGQATKTYSRDLKVFSPIKRHWKNYLSHSATEPVTRENFAACLIENWSGSMESSVKSGFEEAGIYPWDPRMVCKDFPGFASYTPPVVKLPASRLYEKEFEVVRAKLRLIPMYSDSEISRIIRFAQDVLDEAESEND